MTMSAEVSSGSDVIIRMIKVKAAYGAIVVLREIDIELRRGEVLAVLGRNGVGKTTLVSSLFNLGPQVTGDIYIKGERVTGWPTFKIGRLGMALVPQGRGIFPNLTVEEALRMAELRAGRGTRSWTLASIFESFPRLADRRRSFSGSLSGGERQLLAIARGLLTGSDVLLLDEPSEGLAPLAIEEVIVGTVGRLAREGMTMLLAEQNVAMALSLATRAVILAGGRIVFNGNPQELRADRELQREHLGV